MVSTCYVGYTIEMIILLSETVQMDKVPIAKDVYMVLFISVCFAYDITEHDIPWVISTQAAKLQPYIIPK